VTESKDEPSDRWQQLIASFDPERNLRAAADLFTQAASSSERLLQSMGDNIGNGDRRFALRDARAEFERSFDQFAIVAKRLLLELPFGRSADDAPSAGARVAVVDGVGTTVVEIPDAGGAVRCGPLLRHDGAMLDAQHVTVVRSLMFDGEAPTFVIRVDVPHDTPPGTYHGQLLADGLPELAVAFKVTVIGEA
jgi:hypothetical protein